MSADTSCFDNTEALEEQCRRLREENAALKSLLARIVSSLTTVEPHIQPYFGWGKYLVGSYK